MGARPSKVIPAIVALVAGGAGCKSSAPSPRATYQPPAGTALTLLGVEDVDTKASWDPDGKPTTLPASRANNMDDRKTGETYRRLVFVLPGAQTDPLPSYAINPIGNAHDIMFGHMNDTQGGSSTTYDVAGHRWLIVGFTNINPNAAQADIIVKNGGGAWQTMATYHLAKGRLVRIVGPNSIDLKAHLDPPGNATLEVSVELPKSKGMETIRATGFDAQSHVVAHSEEDEFPGGMPLPLSLTGDTKKVVRVEIQKRQSSSLVFRNVRLQPR